MKFLPLFLASLALGVLPTSAQNFPGGHQPFLNLSVRVTISRENPRAIVGFSVPKHDINPNLVKVVLIRAVGPGLVGFGVPDPLPDPVIHVFDSLGKDRTPNYDPRNETNRDGTVDDAAIRTKVFADVAAAAVHVGAFPVPVPTADQPTVSDYSMVGGYGLGSYTVVVSSASGASGDVLVELYAVSP